MKERGGSWFGESPHWALLQMFRYVGHLQRAALERQLNKTGVFRSQHQLLMYIFYHPDASQKEIAQWEHVSPATVAVSLKKLESGGYIRRMVDEQDNRCNQIRITEKGQAVVQESIRCFQEVERQTFEGFTQEDETVMQACLEKMRDNLTAFLDRMEKEESL